jgi:RNA polymerase sigma factor (sigma-70 family)
MDDTELLKEFAARHSEEAFRMLVERHIGFVYSVALRQLRNPSAAQEATQAVFIDLAAKAAAISGKTILAGWLFRAVRFAAAKMIRTEIRRQRREREAAEMEMTLQENTADSPWEQMEPLLNEALAELPEKDRCAVLLRFFEKKPLKEVATHLALNEAAAKKRVGRAVEKLRLIFQKRGVVLPSAVLLAALSTPPLQAAPAGLAATITATAVLKATTITTSTFALSKGIFKIMALSKIKTVGAVTIALLLAGGTTTYVIQKNRAKPSLQTEAEDEAALRVIRSGNSGELAKAPAQVFLRATVPARNQGGGRIMTNGKIMGQAASVRRESMPGTLYLIRNMISL